MLKWNAKNLKTNTEKMYITGSAASHPINVSMTYFLRKKQAQFTLVHGVIYL